MGAMIIVIVLPFPKFVDSVLVEDLVKFLLINAVGTFVAARSRNPGLENLIADLLFVPLRQGRASSGTPVVEDFGVSDCRCLHLAIVTMSTPRASFPLQKGSNRASCASSRPIAYRR